MKQYVFTFEQGNANMRQLLGGKGANLARKICRCWMRTRSTVTLLRHRHVGADKATASTHLFVAQALLRIVHNR